MTENTENQEADLREDFELDPEQVTVLMNKLGAQATGKRIAYIDGALNVPAALSDTIREIMSTHNWDSGALSKAELLAYAADKRWKVETGGIIHAGMKVLTDDRSKQLILGSRILADSAPENFTTPWFDADGIRHDLDAAGMVSLSNAVAIHVTSSFLRYADVIAAIQADEVTTAEQVDQWEWPSNG